MSIPISSRQLRYFELAKKLSRKSDHHRHKLGCVIVNRNKIVGVGWNLLKTHPSSRNKYRTIHAELAAILGIDPADLHGSSVYVFRESTHGLALAKPCPTCNKMLQDCGVREVIYTTNEGYDTYSYY